MQTGHCVCAVCVWVRCVVSNNSFCQQHTVVEVLGQLFATSNQARRFAIHLSMPEFKLIQCEGSLVSTCSLPPHTQVEAAASRRQ